MVNLQEPLRRTPFTTLPLTALVLGLLCLFSVSAAFGQDDLNIHGVVSDAMTSSKISGVDVTVLKDGTKVDEFSTRGNGKYEFYLNVGFSYELYFEKAGFVKRSIQIDARNVPEEVVGAGIIMPTDMSMFAITPAMEGADLSIFDKPIGKASYDAAQADLVWDFQYTQKIKGEINTFIRDLSKKKPELSEEDKAAAAADADFERLMKEGDAAMGNDDYDTAVDKYRGALDIKPDNQNVKGKLGEAETLRNQKREAERKRKAYNDAITAADDFFKNEDYDSAIAKYEEALGEMPNEQYPATQIDAANLIKKDRAAQSARQKEYDDNMRAGNRAVDDEKYEEAIAAFERAMEAKPDEKDAEKMRDTAADLLEQQKANAAAEAEYTAAVEKADKLFDEEKYEEAKVQYDAALAVKPDDAHALERKETCNTRIAALAEAEAQKEAFDGLMAEGAKALEAANYETAVEKYDRALNIFADNEEAKAKRDEAQSLLSEALAEKQKQANYENLIADADKAFDKENYEEARAAYTQAREVIPEETYPLDRLNEIKGIIAAQEAAAAAEKAYSDAMESARKALQANEYDNAIAKYDEALMAKDGDATATEEKAEAVEKKKAFEAQQARDKQYNEKIAAADAKFESASYEEASALYEESKGLKPEESYPQEQLDKIAQAIADLEAKRAEAERLAALQAEFDKVMKAGEAAIGSEDFALAIEKFEAAIDLMPDNPEAPKKKEAAEKLLADQKAAEELSAKYSAAVQRGDEKFEAEDFDEARTAYEEALALKSEESYPKDQIALIEERLAAIAKAEAEAELKAKSEQVSALVLAADQLIGKNEFDDGIDKYNEALAILPDREDIKKKIDDAEAAQAAWLASQAEDEAYAGVIAEADAAFDAKNWESARRNYKQASEIKSDEAYPKERLTLVEKNVKDEADALVAAGDALVSDKEFDEGINKYNEALAVMPDRSDVKKKIADAEAAQADWLASQAEADAYEGVITKADAAFEARDWKSARKNYEQASQIKEDEAYPKDQLALIDKNERDEAEALLASKNAEADALLDAGDALVSDKKFDKGIEKYNDALAILPDRSDIPKKIEAAEAAMLAYMEGRANAEAYDGIIAEADAAFEEKDWDSALQSYNEALTIKPDEKYPKDQIALAEQTRKAEADAAAAAAKAAIDALVAEGDAAAKKKNFEQAVSKFEEALELAPDRSDILAKLEDAQSKMGELLESEALDAAFREAVDSGDAAFKQSDWIEALGYFEQAAGLKPDAAYPKEKIDEINATIAAEEEAAAREAALNAQREFDGLISAGDTQFSKKRYEKALEDYQGALALIPDSEIALKKIAEAEKAISEIDARDADKQAYENAVADADEFFDNEDYEMAKMRYEDALAIRTGEKHPTKRIAEIEKIIERLRLEKVRESEAEAEAEYAAAVKRGDDAMSDKKYENAISAFEDALELKPDEQYPKSRIERARLSIRDMEADRERLAAEAAAAERARAEDQGEYRTVSTKSEEQAEAFMREALDAQERENYARIKKLKSDNADSKEDWISESAEKRSSQHDELMGYYDLSEQIANDGYARSEKRASNSAGYKRALFKNLEIQKEKGNQYQATAYEQIRKDAMGIRQVEYKRQKSNMEELREIAKANRLFTEEYGNYYRRRNREIVESGATAVNERTSDYSTQLDDRKDQADAQRSKNLEDAYDKNRGDAAPQTDFFRMELAMEYPQGVTEESSTLGNKVIITRIVVNGSKGDEYRKVLDKAGNYYFKNGQSISEITWNRETLDAFYSKD